MSALLAVLLLANLAAQLYESWRFHKLSRLYQNQLDEIERLKSSIEWIRKLL